MNEATEEILETKSGTLGVQDPQTEPDTVQDETLAIVFKKTVAKPIIQRVLNHPSIRKIATKSVWPLENGHFGNFGGMGDAYFFGLLDELRIAALWFKNKTPTILREISHIKFTNLSKLMVNYNSIASFEQIYYLNIPQIEAIGLIGNYISSIKTLRKCTFPFLNFLGLEKNFVNDVWYLQQIGFDKGYSILLEKDANDGVVGNDIRWIFKLESQAMQDLWMKSRRRIIQSAAIDNATKVFDHSTIAYTRR